MLRSCLLCLPGEHCAQKAANGLWLMLDDLALGVVSSLLDCNWARCKETPSLTGSTVCHIPCCYRNSLSIVLGSKHSACWHSWDSPITLETSAQHSPRAGLVPQLLSYPGPDVKGKKHCVLSPVGFRPSLCLLSLTIRNGQKCGQINGQQGTKSLRLHICFPKEDARVTWWSSSVLTEQLLVLGNSNVKQHPQQLCLILFILNF